MLLSKSNLSSCLLFSSFFFFCLGGGEAGALVWFLVLLANQYIGNEETTPSSKTMQKEGLRVFK
eukprot:m.177239 g.177239  ORF g.177239 m.177239 type:complete len:64 (-) comp16570_c6_seq2:2107-2298(-)